MHGHTRGHVLGKNGKKDRWGLCVSLSLELTLGVHVINACVLREHGHVTSCLKQDYFRGESKTISGVKEAPGRKGAITLRINQNCIRDTETVTLTYTDIAIVSLKPKPSCKSRTSCCPMD